jgi:Sulfatase
MTEPSGRESTGLQSSWLQGCGAAILLMLGILWLHISPLHSDLYHRVLPLNSVYWGVVIDLAIVCALAGGVLSLLKKTDSTQRSAWWAMIAAVLLWRLHLFLIWQGSIPARPVKPNITLLVCIGIGLALRFTSRAGYQRMVQGLQLVLGLVGVCIFWIMPELLYTAIHPEPHEQPGFARVVPQAVKPERRVVWVVFDELSQDQLTDHRQPGIDLPAFDRLRSESVTFSNVQPAGYYTELVLPSLLWGNIVKGERSNLDGQLSVKTNNGWQRFPADQSIFADAHRAGWSTGVAGWYNPYCRTYAAELDRCRWLLSTPIPGEYSPQQSVVWNVFAPVRKSVLRLVGHKFRAPTNAVVHASDYSKMMDWSHQLIDDEDVRFVFLHLPIPHPYGIYDRRTAQMGVEGSYLDNLVLADSAMSQIMQWIDSTQSAAETTLVVCSDHSWRVPMWRKTPGWTAEDEAAAKGRFDTRPVLMVRLAGETQPQAISQAFPALKEHDLVETLLKGSPTPDALGAWALAQR